MFNSLKIVLFLLELSLSSLQLLAELIHYLNKCFSYYETHVTIGTLLYYLFNR
jgi:hypothetical protein